ncbi:hypothetical protein [Streptomyces sp. WM6378]|uniref:hypothetical protein n=1 Tax=Streptomyces sp. WM6378 TaxID=1415557 RepID=UPI0006AE9899|nr:hypothetical protein [Streptomyces sp. WM6378]KOU52636.1 hypothetical protein ADK54_06730 [Streptomyces sp. WM6378]
MRRILRAVTAVGLLAIPTIAFIAPAQAVSHGLVKVQVSGCGEEQLLEQQAAKLADQAEIEEISEETAPYYAMWEEDVDTGVQVAANDQTQVNNGEVTQSQVGLVNVGLNNVLSQDEISALSDLHELCGALTHVGILD